MAEGNRESGVTDDDVEWHSACMHMIQMEMDSAVAVRVGQVWYRVGRDRHRASEGKPGNEMR